MNEPIVADVPDARRFEATVEGELAGYAEYRDNGRRRTFTHTVVEPAYEGKGIGSALVRAVLEAARTNDLAVLPRCTFVRGYIDRHRDEYVDLVPEADRAAYDL